MHHLLLDDTFLETYRLAVSQTPSQIATWVEPAFRAGMFAQALALIHWTFNHCGIRGIEVSDYSLKEGAMYRIMEQAKIPVVLQ